MCGITGLIYKGSAEDGRGILHAMNDAIAHRGPDGEGFYEQGNVFLGHRRLSIIDLSERGKQPMQSSSGRFTIVFNGEIYNYRELKAELKDVSWKSDSDSEVILEAWEKWGEACLPRLIGMFAFAIHDKTENSLTLVRDRLGVKPVYFMNRRGHFAFASEVRSLLRSGLASRQLNTAALQEYLTYQSVSAPQTLAEGIFSLGAGELLVWKHEALVIRKWYELCRSASAEASTLNADAIRKRTLELCRKAVARRMVADVPVAAFLSGGIDSSAVVALMAQQSEQRIETFSVVFGEKDFDESAWSGLIARKYNTSHHPILLKPADFLKELPQALAAMDHPSGDGPNSYVVSGVTAKQGIKVALSGIGGDELFAGYPFFSQLMRLRKNPVLKFTPAFLKKMLAGIAATVPGGRRGEKLAALLRLKTAQLGEVFPAYRRLYSAVMLSEMLKEEKDSLPVHLWLKENKNALNSLPYVSRISAAEISIYLHNVLLRDTDQMSMAHSLEVREPFLDHELLSFVLGVPDQHKLPGAPKKLLTDALGDLLPREVVHRRKMGFTFPWSRWLKNELKDFCAHRLARLEQRGILAMGSVTRLWERFLKGDKRVLWNHVWVLVVLEEWMQRNEIEG